MATATRVASSTDDTTVYASYKVDEGVPTGVVEYNVSTPIYDDSGTQKPDAEVSSELKAALVAARAANVSAAGPTVTVPSTFTL